MTEADRTADNALGRLLILVLAAALCVLILDRTPIANGFSVLPGDRYDGVIASVILEHWYSVFTGQTPWTEVGYFYPYTHTLAQTDSHLINGLLYIPFRATGLDPFLSAHLSKLPLRLFGFFAFYALCRKYKVSFGWAAVAAALFTLSNAVTSHGSRLQLASIAVAPFMAILVWNTLAGIINQNSRAVLMWGSAAGFTFGLWCMTTFYMAWSFFYLFLVWGAVLVIWAGRDRLLVFWFATCKVWPALVAVVVVAAASIAPFAYIYLPKAAETGIRSFDDAWMFTVLPVEIIQVGVQNILFGDITQAIIKRINPAYVATGEYSNTGPNIALAFLLLAAVISAIYADRSSWRSLGFAALALATVITWATTIRIGHTSLWLLVYHTIPGAKALRVVSIHQMFLIGPMLFLVAAYLSRQAIPAVIAILVAGVLLLGELNQEYINLHRNDELQRLAEIPAPPASCEAFYVTGWNEQANADHIGNLYAHNVSAMAISQVLDLPTINGFASFNPPDWDFGSPGAADYESRVAEYAKDHRIADSLCRLDLDEKSWSALELNRLNAR